MKNKLLLNSETEKQIDNFIAKPSHALLILGPSGAGKYALGRMVSARLLDVDEARLNNQPFFREVSWTENKQSIAIESIREIIKWLSLKVPSNNVVNRIVLIADAGDMTTEAQNALLKSLEEPPAGTVFILSAQNERNLLPTIASRTTKLNVRPISLASAIKYFSGSPEREIESAWRLSQGWAGLLNSLLSDETHELKSAVKLAKKFIAQSTYDRLLMLDSISATKADFASFLIGLGRVLQALYKSPANQAQTARLTGSMDLVLRCRRDLEINISLRLVALSLALNLKV